MDIMDAVGGGTSGEGGSIDWSALINIGQQIYENIQSEKKTKEEWAREDKRRQLEYQEREKERRIAERARIDSLGVAKRAQNQDGLNYITNLVKSNQAASRRTGFENALLRHAGY